MPSSAWKFVGGLLVPAGLIVAYDGTTISPTTGWSLFTAANDLFLRGTTDDSVVGTTGTGYGLSLTTSSSGSHNGGPSTEEVLNRGYYSYCTHNCNNPSYNSSSVGGHQHSISFNYVPKSNRIALIQAGISAPLPSNAVMFGTSENATQELLDPVSQDAYLYAHASAKAIVAATKIAYTTGNGSDYHSHEIGALRTSLSATSSWRSSVSAGGGNHTHSGGTPTITPAHAQIALRAFKILDALKLSGLIGMWVGAGVPSGWSYVAGSNGSMIYLANTGDGTASGDDTVAISGSSGSSSHSHSYGSSGSSYEETSIIPHGGSVSHSHSYSGTKSYLPPRYNIKFIRYDG